MTAFIMWLNSIAGKMRKILCFDWLPKHILPTRNSHVSPARKNYLFRHIINLLLTNRLARSRWLGINHPLFYVFIDLAFVSEEK